MILRRAKGRGSRNGAIITCSACIIALVVVLVAFVTSTASSTAHATTDRQYSWVVPGAYALYIGHSTLPNNQAYNMTYVWKVIAVNESKAQVLTEMNVTTGSGPQRTISKDVSWISLQEPGGLLSPGLAQEVESLFETHTSIDGRPIDVYTFGGAVNGDIQVVLYVNPVIGLPSEFTYSVVGADSINELLVSTNIPGMG